MTDQTAHTLLREALDLLNDAPRFSLRRDRSRSSYALASTIEAYLALGGDLLAPDDVVAITRELWRGDDHVLIPETPLMRLDPNGMWISAWLLAGAGPAGADTTLPERYRTIVGHLPLLTREVFLLHRRDGWAFPAISQRLGITVVEVQQHLADALLKLTDALGEG